MAFEVVDAGLTGTRWAWRVWFDEATNQLRLSGRHHVMGVPGLASDLTWRRARAAGVADELSESVPPLEPFTVPWTPAQRRRILADLGPDGAGVTVIQLRGWQARWWNRELVTVGWAEPKRRRSRELFDTATVTKLEAWRQRVRDADRG